MHVWMYGHLYLIGFYCEEYNIITKKLNVKLERYLHPESKRINQVLRQQSLWALSVDLVHIVSSRVTLLNIL